MTQQIGEDTYQRLREEWKEKLQHAEIDLSELERNVTLHLDDLDTALLLLTKIDTLYSRLTIQQRSLLLQIIANRIIVNAQGEIIEHELNPPFMYLSVLHGSLITKNRSKSGSEQVSVGAPNNTHFEL
jgi:hypothetical protein